MAEAPVAFGEEEAGEPSPAVSAGPCAGAGRASSGRPPERLGSVATSVLLPVTAAGDDGAEGRSLPAGADGTTASRLSRRAGSFGMAGGAVDPFADWAPFDESASLLAPVPGSAGGVEGAAAVGAGISGTARLALSPGPLVTP